jgi:hypothetical protein
MDKLKHPTKQITFDEETLDVLRNDLFWEEGGTLCTITRTLTTELYLKVNHALDLLGGHWDRKKSGHVFETSPLDKLEKMIESGKAEKVLDGYFATPKSVIDRMINMAGGALCGTVLEPSAGMGAIVERILEFPVACIAYETDERRAAHLKQEFEPRGCAVICEDFLEVPPGMIKADYILMNPPFEHERAVDHIRHAYTMLKPLTGQLVAVADEGCFFRETKKAREFREWLDKIGAVIVKNGPNAFAKSGTKALTRLIYVDLGAQTLREAGAS